MWNEEKFPSLMWIVCRMIEVMKERYLGSETDLWKNNPIFMTGPAVLTDTVKRYFKLPYPVSGWLGRVYHVRAPWTFQKISFVRVKCEKEVSCAEIAYLLAERQVLKYLLGYKRQSCCKAINLSVFAESPRVLEIHSFYLALSAVCSVHEIHILLQKAIMS